MSKSTVFLQCEAQYDRRWSAKDGEYKEVVKAHKVVGFTQKRPGKPRSGTVLVKLTIDIPDGAFMPLEPEAVVTIPDSLTVLAPIEVEAEDPNQTDE